MNKNVVIVDILITELSQQPSRIPLINDPNNGTPEGFISHFARVLDIRRDTIYLDNTLPYVAASHWEVSRADFEAIWEYPEKRASNADYMEGLLQAQGLNLEREATRWAVVINGDATPKLN